MLEPNQLEALEDRALELLQEKMMGRKFLDWVAFPKLPPGALWPEKFETVGEVHVTEWADHGRGPTTESCTVPATFRVEQAGALVAFAVSFTHGGETFEAELVHDLCSD